MSEQIKSLPLCEHCLKYKNEVKMNPKKLEPLEVKHKMIIGKIQGYPYPFVYLAYNYFECPICHWFKFEKKPQIKTAKVDGYDY